MKVYDVGEPNALLRFERLAGLFGVCSAVCLGLAINGCCPPLLPGDEQVAADTPVPPGQTDQPDNGNEVTPIDFTGSFTTAWTHNDVRRMVLGTTNTIPFVVPPSEKIMPGYWVWDSWPVLERDGSLAVINGHYVIISLTAPDTILPGKRHDVATWRYMYSSNGRDWTDGGDVFPEGDALGSRQWAGSAIYDPDENRVTFFYTAAGQRGEDPFADDGADDDQDNGQDDAQDDQDDGAPQEGGPSGGDPASGDLTYGQRMVQVSAFVVSDPQPVTFVGWGEHTIMVEPDRYWYEQSEGFAGGFVFAWRDPYYFRDPRSGRSFITFTARSAGTVEFSAWNGVVGLAVADDEELTSWTLLPPLLDALQVNNELERPHHLYIDGRYYMFFTSGTAERFDPSLSDVEAIRPTGAYGFVADEFQGPYTPLNGSGLVLANPLAAPAQTYSYQVLPGGYVFMFIDYVDTGEEGTQDISPEWHMQHFQGTLAPLLQIEISGEQTQLIGWPKDIFELIDELEKLPPPEPIEPVPVPDPDGDPQPS